MFYWKRCPALLAATALMFAASGSLFAQDEAKAAPAPAPAPSAAPKEASEELRDLRTAVDKQSLQIEMLTRELSLLRKKMEGGAPADSTAPAPNEHPAEKTEKPAPAAADQPEVRNAEATGGGVKHIVAKGETLTSIAKQYNIPVTTLQKANKIQDGRKMQIGQVLSIPSPSENTPEKKENP